jgi:hypothetical protein
VAAAAVSSRVVADGTMTGATITGLTAADVNPDSTLYRTVSVDCGDPVGTLTTSTGCVRPCARACVFPDGPILECDGIDDGNDPCVCASVLLANLLPACRHTAIGRLVQ